MLASLALALEAEVQQDWLWVFVFLLVGIAFPVGAVAVGWLLSPRAVGRDHESTYESGIPPTGPAWVRFSISFYLFALIFVAFAVDILFLVPVALVFNDGQTPADLIEIFIFVGILALAVLYAWARGVFDWE